MDSIKNLINNINLFGHEVGDRPLKVNVIYNEYGWIIYKFAISLCNQLKEFGVNASISQEYDKSADINHYFFPNTAPVSNDRVTFMVTHVDTQKKINMIKNQTDNGAIGICMSLETRNMLISYGIKPNKICYVNPAQDGQIHPKKISLGFTHRTYNDYRKRESMVVDVCEKIDPNIFRFVIMGAGWDSIIEQMRNLGFEVEYYSEFDKEKYNTLMVNLDYYCYFGFDEGSMGFLDAVAAGIGTIVTPQGYHLDTKCGITYPVKDIDDIVAALHEIEEKRKKSLDFIKTWTWENYAKKHLEIWNYMLGAKDMSEIMSTRGWYTDGIYSLMLE